MLEVSHLNPGCGMEGGSPRGLRDRHARSDVVRAHPQPDL